MARFCAALLPEGRRSRRRRFRPGHPLRHPEPPGGVQPGGAAGHHHRLLARRRPEQQRVRHRELHRGAGAQGGPGPDRLPARPSGQDAPPAGGARPRAREVGLGTAAAAALRARRRGAAIVRQLHRHGRRMRGRRCRRGDAAARHQRGRHGHRGQPGHDGGPAAGRPDLRPDRGALRRDHAGEGPRPAVELPRLPDAAHRPGPADRCAS